MSGTYRVFEDGVLISETKNVLTAAGKAAILGIMAGTTPRISRLGLGIMPTAPGGFDPAVTDTTLNFPLVDTPVLFTIPLYGGASSKIVYKSRLDETVSGVIYEIGSYNGPEINEPLLVSFGDADTDVVGPAGGGANDVRIGPTSPQLTTTTALVITKAASAGSLLPTDQIALACKPSAATASVITIIITDANGSTATKTFTLAANTSYQVIRNAVNTFGFVLASGVTTFDWDSISSVSAQRDAAANNIILDGLAVLSPLQAGELMSHAKYTTPLVKRAGVRMDIEYELTFNLA